MPREISDIKTFIEIARRKDASCMYNPRLELHRGGKTEPVFIVGHNLVVVGR